MLTKFLDRQKNVYAAAPKGASCRLLCRKRDKRTTAEGRRRALVTYGADRRS